MTLSHQPLNGFPAPAQTWPGSSTAPGAPTPVTAEQIEAWREQFIELILQAVVQAVKGVFVPGAIGSAFDQLVDWADNLADSLGLGTLFDNLQALFGGDFSLADFDIQAAVERLLGVGENYEMPLTLPTTLGAASPLQQFFINLRGFLSADFLGSDFDLVATAVNFIETVLKPQGLLAELIDGILPDGQAPQALSDLMQNIINAFTKDGPVGLSGIFGGELQSVFDIVDGLLAKTDTNTASILALEGEVFAAAGTGAITEDFNGAAGDLEGVGWTRLNYGPGSSASLARQDAYCFVDPHGGGSDQTLFYIRPTDTLSSHVQKTTHILRKKISASGPCAYYIPLRCNNAATTGALSLVFTYIDDNTVTCGYVLNGTATYFTTGQVDPVSYSRADQERWDFQVGDPADVGGTGDWRWQVWRNNQKLIDDIYDPSQSAFLTAATYNRCAIGMVADGIFGGMVGPTEVEGITWQVPA